MYGGKESGDGSKNLCNNVTARPELNDGKVQRAQKKTCPAVKWPNVQPHLTFETGSEVKRKVKNLL